MISFIYMVFQRCGIVEHGRYYQNVHKYSNMLPGLNDINNLSFTRRVNILKTIAKV
jgi:hypothetical protein